MGTNSEQLNLAVVGLGGWGPNLLRNALAAPGARVACVCDVDEGRLAAVGAQAPQARRTRDYGTVLSDPAVDAVILATPAALHVEHATAAINAGKHVLVEKPLALSPAEGERVAAMAHGRGLTLMVGHTFLYNGAVVALRDLVARGHLGRVLFVRAERLSLGKVRDDVNAWWNLAPHDVSILLALFGALPVRVRATGGVFLPGSSLHDVVTATLEFPGGSLATVHCSWLNPEKVRRMTVVGDRRMAVYDDVLAKGRIRVYDKGIDSDPYDDPTGSYTRFRRHLRAGEESLPPYDEGEPLAAEIEHFVACIKAGTEPRTGAAEALGVLRVLAACQQSLDADGVPVVLEGTPP